MCRCPVRHSKPLRRLQSLCQWSGWHNISGQNWANSPHPRWNIVSPICEAVCLLYLPTCSARPRRPVAAKNRRSREPYISAERVIATVPADLAGSRVIGRRSTAFCSRRYESDPRAAVHSSALAPEQACFQCSPFLLAGIVRYSVANGVARL